MDGAKEAKFGTRVA